jgi:hypothetical protein
MKLIISIVIILSITQIENKALTFVEMNYLYQFGDLDTDQFNYLNPEQLRYIFRMKNNFKTLNSLFAKEAENRSAPDFACLVEWNANKKSRYYIPTPNEYRDIKMTMDFIKSDFPKALMDAKEAYQKLIKERDDMVDKMNKDYKNELKDAEKNNLNLKTALENYKKASKKFDKQEAIKFKIEYDKILNELEIEDLKDKVKRVTEEFTSQKNFLDAKALYKEMDLDFQNSFDQNKGRLKDYLLNCGKLPKDWESNINLYFILLFIEKIKEIRKEYDDEFFPYDNFNFVEYIPTDKISEEKKGKGDDLGEIDRKRWYMFKELWDLFGTLALYQEIDYDWHITMKSTGVLHRDGYKIKIEETGAQQNPPTYSIINTETEKKIEEKIVQGEKFQKNFKALEANKSEMKENKSPKQSILFMYNNKKITCELPKTIAIWSSKEDGLDSQNFGVHECYFKNENGEKILNEKVVVICTHYKSKDDGFESRMNIGNEITKYVNRFHPNDNIVLMGDLNAEIGEIATSLDAIVRRSSKNSQDSFTSYVPNPDLLMKNIKLTSEQTNLVTEIKDLKKIIEESKQVYQAQNYLNAANDKFIDSLEKNQNDLITLSENFERRLASDNLNNNSYNTWEETSSRPTESKIRIKQIDYFNPKFLKFIHEVEKSKKFIGGCFTKFKDLVLENKKNLKHNPLIKEAFILWTNCLRTNIAFEEAKDQLDNLLRSLVEEEKIDYILLRFRNSFEVKKIYEIDNYDKHLEMGCPNEEYSSDHLPTHVTLDIDFEGNMVQTLI